MSKKILIIEDEKDIVELIAHYLEKDGFKTSTASLNKSEYFHQKAISSGNRSEVENTQMIAAYFPMLIN